MKAYLISKYKKYIENLKWHLKNNDPSEEEKKEIYLKIRIYEEVLSDLEEL